MSQVESGRNKLKTLAFAALEVGTEGFFGRTLVSVGFFNIVMVLVGPSPALEVVTEGFVCVALVSVGFGVAYPVSKFK